MGYCIKRNGGDSVYVFTSKRPLLSFTRSYVFTVLSLRLEFFFSEVRGPLFALLSQRGFILATLCNEKTPVNCFLDRSLYLRLRILKRKSNFLSGNNQGLVVLVNRSETCNFHSWVQNPLVRPSTKCQKPTRLRYIYSR